MGRKLYYGWVLVATLGVTETISWGILYYAFTVYLAPMEAEQGWSRGDITGAFSLGLLLAGLAAIPVGRWLDRNGPRLLMTVGSIAGTLLVVAWSGVTNLPQLYLVWAAIGLAMSATLYDPAFATATRSCCDADPRTTDCCRMASRCISARSNAAWRRRACTWARRYAIRRFGGWSLRSG